MNKERGDRARGKERVVLKVQDWFLPALYQVGNDGALFNPHPQPLSQGARGAREENPDLLSPSTSGRGARGEGNLREVQEAGFWGRSRELWEIERAYVRGTRRITISGFGGMGKTYLAEEAGRWLLRTGMFARVCFISFADFQGVDPVSYAVSVLATVLDTNLIDGAAATRALREQAVLVILDNLETIRSPLPPLVKGGKEEDSDQAPLSKGGRGDQALLDIAKEWSEAENSRVLLTTRAADLQHSDYPNQGSLRHIPLPLRGLSEGDALDYFQSLIKLPPEPQFGLPPRDGLLELFKLLDYHPLSLGLLAVQLKQRRALEVHRELAQLVADTPNNPLLASLNLSVSRLDPQAHDWIKRLGVFQGRAWEPRIHLITEILETDWYKIRSQLEVNGLIQIKKIAHASDGIVFLKFHPSLAPVMWSQLTDSEQQQLSRRHRQYYYQLSRYLYLENRKSNPFGVRVLAKWELPNLLFAVYGAIESRDDFAADFVENISSFLDDFWLKQDRENLTRQVQRIASNIGSKDWYLTQSNLGEQLLSTANYKKAESLFLEILEGLGKTSNYERCITINRLGKCYKGMQQLEKAIVQYRLALDIAAQLEQTNDIKRQIGVLYSDLGEVLRSIEDYEYARQSYETSLGIMKEVNDTRSQAVIKCQLGILALVQNNFVEAIRILQESLIIFHELNEPATEAIILHELGIAFCEMGNLKEAEQAYRQSAQIKDVHGLVGGANGLAITWNSLAVVSTRSGQFYEAEEWYQKAINGFKNIGDLPSVSQVPD